MLKERLSRRNWLYKEKLYAPLYESAEMLREVHSPRISIIVISWRRHPDTKRCFAALERQRGCRFELLFVDNGAKDSEFEDLKTSIDTFITLNRNTGAFVARNIGALFAKAPLLLFLEDDGIPEEDLVRSHLRAHEGGNFTVVRGVYLPKTDSPFNSIPKHYFLGDKPIPFHANVEGNTSYRADRFFDAGGWNDRIRYGHGGIELGIRLREKEEDPCRQIYSPGPVLYHDYAADREHMLRKRMLHDDSLLQLLRSYPDFIDVMKYWRNVGARRIPPPECWRDGETETPRWMDERMRILFERIASKGDPRPFSYYQCYFERLVPVREARDPEISVVVVSTRAAAGIEESLGKLAGEKGARSAIVLVGRDGDAAPDGALRDCLNVYVAFRGNPTRTTAMNLGAFFTSAPVILFFGEDLVPSGDLLRRHLDAHRTYKADTVQGKVEGVSRPASDLVNISVRASLFFRMLGWSALLPAGEAQDEFTQRVLEKEGDFTPIRAAAVARVRQ